MNDKETELLFILDVEDGWPPVSIEGIPCKVVNGTHQIKAAPLFVKDISVDDIIEVVFDSFGKVSSWHHVQKSNRSTIWLLRTAGTQNIDVILQELRALDCNTVRLPQYGSYSIDVPAEVEMQEVDFFLAKLDPNSVSVAYPSFRHEDS